MHCPDAATFLFPVPVSLDFINIGDSSTKVILESLCLFFVLPKRIYTNTVRTRTRTTNINTTGMTMTVDNTPFDCSVLEKKKQKL